MESGSLLRKISVVSGVVAGGVALASCGQETSGAAGDQSSTPSTPQVSPISPCELVTAAELKEATGISFNEGQKRGPVCDFATADYASTASVSTGLDTVADHLDTKKITISGAEAVQGQPPEGDQCLVDVPLGSDAPVEMLNTAISEVDPADRPCEIATAIAEKALASLKD
ncbi:MULTISPECIES: DUF3558 family protein [Prauserella salsuginis group]|uniref:DUF3558 domain-containing protein n=2 Tax=Prauserella salsuginis group TaxID=2893672 RepID=A0A839XMY9_9PSEU|nr:MULTISPECIES: DUF3558 family protein [Prauserella salsuginis group]MBB3662083.1 hypothetical protein [Prauserella sediminis]MCR3719775.1 Protein of unknown function (DUF3558) [Prauserella flava]MCR3736682.1 Protein of unknown function (DUF3558) [Prauserella salsuginis]